MSPKQMKETNLVLLQVQLQGAYTIDVLQEEVTAFEQKVLSGFDAHAGQRMIQGSSSLSILKVKVDTLCVRNLNEA